MSFIIRKIKTDLSPESLDNAIRQVETIRDKIHPAMMHMISWLAEKGVEIARAELIFFDDPAYYTGSLSESVTFTINDNGAVISAGEGLGCGDAPYDISYAYFVEYGTGVFGADINGHGWAGWSYENGGRWYHTIGMPARPFMHNTYEDLQEEAKVEAGRVVAEYLADWSGYS